MNIRFAGYKRTYRNGGSQHNGKIQASRHDPRSILVSESKSLRLLMTESDERQLMLRLEKLAHAEGLREDRTGVKLPSYTQSLIDSKANDSEVFKKDGSVVLGGSFTFKELSGEPGDPAEGHAVLWMTDGSGSGDKGDIMIKVTAGGITKIATLVDFSAI